MIIDRSEKIRKQTLRRQKNSKDGPLTKLGRKRGGCLLTEETEEPQVVQWKEKAIGTLWASMWWGGRFCKQGFQTDVRFNLTDRAPEAWVASKDSGSKRDQEKVKDAARVINTTDAADTKVSASFNDWWEVQQASDTVSRR